MPRPYKARLAGDRQWPCRAALREGVSGSQKLPSRPRANGSPAQAAAPGKNREEMVRKIAIAAAMIGLLAGTVQSQAQKRQDSDKTDKTLLQIEQEERAQRAKEVDKDYQRAIKGSRPPSTPSTADPWKSVRPAPKDNKTN
jgi:hypothetical protein